MIDFSSKMQQLGRKTTPDWNTYAGKRPQTVWRGGRIMYDNVVVVDDDDVDVGDDDLEDDDVADDDVEDNDVEDNEVLKMMMLRMVMLRRMRMTMRKRKGRLFIFGFSFRGRF